MGDAELRNLELRLRMALDHAAQAAADLDRARAQHGLPPLREASAHAEMSAAELIVLAGDVRRGTAVDITDAQRQRLNVLPFDRKP
jgi:hypothetical protein